MGGSHACRRGEGVLQLDRGVGSGCTSSCPSSSYYYFIFVLASSSCGSRLMWFNGWLCNLAPVAAACGRGRLHVRLLWSGAQAGVQGLSATRRTVSDSEVAMFSTNSYFRKQQSTTHYVTCLTPKGKHWADCVVGPEHTMLQRAPDRHTKQPPLSLPSLPPPLVCSFPHPLPC